MNDAHPRRGFTLLELIIVIAVIAVIAALAIPGVISSQRSANERNGSASLRTFSTAEIDFRTNDRDGNKILDFWTRDVSGLYSLCPIGSTEAVKLIDIALCGADSAPQGTAAAPIFADQVDNAFYVARAPKASYWYIALQEDETGSPYATVTGGLDPLDDKAWFHPTKFAFSAYPDSYSVARVLYVLNESHVIFRRPLRGNVRPAGALSPPGTALIDAGALGDAPLLRWPTEEQLKSSYTKLD